MLKRPSLSQRDLAVQGGRSSFGRFDQPRRLVLERENVRPQPLLKKKRKGDIVTSAQRLWASMPFGRHSWIVRGAGSELFCKGGR